MSEHNSQQGINKCTICMERLGRASIDGCQHSFCLRCIRRWSNSKNTCPLCRESFRQIKQGKRSYKIKQRPDARKSPLIQGRTPRILGISANYFPINLNPINPIPLYFFYFFPNQFVTNPDLTSPFNGQVGLYQSVPLQP